MSIAAIERLLKETMGLDGQSIGPSAIARAIAERQRACGLDGVDAYADHLAGSPTERQELIEAVVVPETWFFRDREAFGALGRLALGWHRSQPDQTIQLLSLPCATGEEPYSMAMTLLDAGLPPACFSIDAVDISEHALARARRGLYGKGAFRTDDLSFRDRYFEFGGGLHQLLPSVREHVRFQRGNLLALNGAATADRYHVVWCRNLLIYFDRPTQDAAVRILRQLLRRDGVLFVGPSETGILTQHRFHSARLPLAFAFRTSEAETAASARVTPPPEPARRRVARPPMRKSVPWVAPVRPVPTDKRESAAPRRDDPQADLGHARQLADAGRFAEAATCCEAHLRRHGPSADALYLLGLVCDASRQSDKASEYYRKALYLEPQHREALTHLMLLLDREGNRPQADALRQRIERLGAQDVA